MPLVRYTWLHEEGHTNTEEALLPFTSTPEQTLLQTEPVLIVNPNRLIKVEVLNPLIHEHKWKRLSKTGDRVNFECEHCGIVAWRLFNNFKGLIGPYNRDDSHKSAKHETCRSPLKAMPPSTSLFK